MIPDWLLSAFILFFILGAVGVWLYLLSKWLGFLGKTGKSILGRRKK